MNLINTTGLALIGPGSEWFWSMLQLVVVAASIVGIYFQLRVQRASSLYEQNAAWVRQWNDESFTVTRLGALIDLEGRKTEAGLPRSSAEVGDYFERLGYLIAQNYLRSTDVWHSMRMPIGEWWALMGPYLESTRHDLANPKIFEWFEKLEVEMRRLDKKTFGHALTFEASDDVGRLIDAETTWLRRQAEARNGIYPSRRGQVKEVAEA